MNKKLQENMYIRTKCNDFCNQVAIRKIIEIDEEDSNSFYIDGYIFDICGDQQNKLQVDDVEKASFDIFDILKIGDFLDTHCIEDIKNNTCFLNDGYFINRDDIVYLVGTICTNEDFESMWYEL